MSDPFHSSKYVIARAKHHVRDLERQIAEFIESDPYSRVVEIDPNTSEEVHKIKLAKPMPVALPGLAADAVNNMRSALDQAIYTLTGARNTYFPIARTQSDFENAVKGRCKDLPEEIIELIRTLKPYKGGNNLLWALNELCNTNKHSFISPVAMASGGTYVKRITMLSGGFDLPRHIWNRTKNEMELLRVQPGTTIDFDFTIATFVAIHDVEVVDGQPVVAVFNELGRMVEGIVMTIEAESRRLGLV